MGVGVVYLLSWWKYRIVDGFVIYGIYFYWIWLVWNDLVYVNCRYWCSGFV